LLARVHQRVHRTRHEPVVDEDVLFDAQRGIAALEITSAIVADPMAQGQVLCARGSADRIRLHEPEPLDRALQRGWWEQGAGDGERAELVESHSLFRNGVPGGSRGYSGVPGGSRF